MSNLKIKDEDAAKTVQFWADVKGVIYKGNACYTFFIMRGRIESNMIVPFSCMRLLKLDKHY